MVSFCWCYNCNAKFLKKSPRLVFKFRIWVINSKISLSIEIYNSKEFIFFKKSIGRWCQSQKNDRCVGRRWASLIVVDFFQFCYCCWLFKVRKLCDGIPCILCVCIHFFLSRWFYFIIFSFIFFFLHHKRRNLMFVSDFRYSEKKNEREKPNWSYAAARP